MTHRFPLPRLTLLVTALVAGAASWAFTPSALAMPADAQRPDNATSVRIGRIVAERDCATCHAVGRRGASPNRRAPRFPLIAERYPNENPAPDLADGIVTRHRGMPEFRLNEDETDGLIAYIRWISRKRPAPDRR
jgi:mono/diheme cytochrome c family protein